MFKERLRSLLDRVEGARGVSLVAEDGIAVDSVSADPELDLEVLAAELLTQVNRLASGSPDLALGAVSQFSITADRYSVLLGALTESYYLMVVVAAGGSFGRARFELRRAPLDFAEDLI